MSLFATFKLKNPTKVHNSQYIKTENEPVKEDTTPVTPETPTEPESK